MVLDPIIMNRLIKAAHKNTCPRPSASNWPKSFKSVDGVWELHFLDANDIKRVVRDD